MTSSPSPACVRGAIPLQHRFHHSRHRCRRPADQLAQLTPIVEQRAFRYARIRIRQQFGEEFRQARAEQLFLVFRFRQVDVADGLAALARDFGGEFAGCRVGAASCRSRTSAGGATVGGDRAGKPVEAKVIEIFA